MIETILFDLDGTLVDTAPDLGAAANHVREHLGQPPLPLVDYRPVASAGARGLLRKALGIEPSDPGYDPLRERFLNHYLAHIADQSRPFEGMSELLERIEARGDRWGVVTNKPGWLTRPLLKALDLAERAACCVSGDDVRQAKPAPDSLLLAADQLGIDPAAAAYVGDDRRDIDAARAAGMIPVVAQWGYLGENQTGTDWQARYVAPDPLALDRWLCRPSESQFTTLKAQ